MPDANAIDRTRTRLAIALSTLAGAVDALGFITLGGFFVSFMTGNTTRLAVGLAAGDLREAATGGLIVLLFVCGALAGFATARSFPHHARQTVCALLVLVLAAGALCHDAGADHAAAAAMTLAMGAENSIFQSRSGKTIGLTYMTGALVRTAQHLADALAGGPRWLWLESFLLWAGLAVGAALGALLHHAIGLDALWVTAAAAAIIAVPLGRLPVAS